MSPTRAESTTAPDREAGFTLLEVLAAVAVAGFILSAIGSILAVSMAGIRSAADRVVLAESARTLLDTLPQGSALKAGTTTGTLGTVRWQMDVVPRPPVTARRTADGAPGAEGAPPAEGASAPNWRPASIAIVARTPSGRRLRLDTIGFIRLAAP